MTKMSYVYVAIGFVIYYGIIYIWSEWFDKANPRKKDEPATTNLTTK
jgi:hypothetical protein